MLGKLLKYEIPALGRKLIPLYIAWLAASVLLGFALNSVSQDIEFFIVISGLIYAMVTTAVIVMAVILIVQRYRNSLLGDEAYFSLVLPVTASEHIANKTVSALVWVVASGIAAAISGLIIALISGALSLGELFDPKMWHEILSQLELADGLLLIEVLVLTAFSTVKSILAIYAALTIGHQARKRVWLTSIVAYIILMTIEAIIGRAAVGIFVLFGVDFEANILGSQVVICTAFVTTALLAAFYFFLCKYLMEKRLNLD